MLYELAFTVAAEHAEALGDALLAAGALAVSVEDAETETEAEQPLYGEPGLLPQRAAWRRSRLAVLVDAATDREQLLAAATAQVVSAVLGTVDTRAVQDADWVRLTQAQFQPSRIAEGLWIVPTWHTPPEPDAICVRLDPGAAFGTGTHPTTRLCLRWLARERPRGAVLDYGCGSGILAIAAAKLSAAAVVGCDIDPQALPVARANAQLNGVSVSFVLPEALDPQRRDDVVLANILASSLKVLAPMLLARVAPGGALVLSGILERQADELTAAYAAHDPGLPLAVAGVEDGWVCLAGRRA
ncbi:MAG: 50S ribosomal protein L11 methyltransferase [Burkholderiales bacterium]|jgi:ribosomal protein L11 methyltransferase|nr:50S ribosomal protein L11 methyltransferase [Burkholderiales bacterium]